MSGPVSTEIRELDGGAPCFCIALDAPRSNALEPGILTAFLTALDALADSGAEHALLIGGRNFSTGGDVGRFHDAAVRGTAQAYADEVVPLLQVCVSRMIEMPVLFAAAARGAVTGGSAGFLFASDLVVLAPDAFVQPYYTVVGFAPDGGWTALLPERIGVGAAQDWLLRDARYDAEALRARGLAADVDAAPETRALALLSALDANTARATKALLWDDDRRARVGRRLAMETAAFRALIGRDDTRAKMERFLGR